MKHLFRHQMLLVLCGVALASLVGAATARAQAPTTFFVPTARTIAGPGDVSVDPNVNPGTTIFRSKGIKVCVTVQNDEDPSSDSTVTVTLTDFPLSGIAPVDVKPGEAASVCASKIVSVSTTLGSGTWASYHWRVDAQ